jgi:hypothetical protein
VILAVAGDRRYVDYGHFSKILSDELEKFPAGYLVTGDARGVDTMALQYALERKIPHTVYCASSTTYMTLKRRDINVELVADWNKDGRAAGHIRNGFMLRHPVNRVLLLNGGGAGSNNMKKQTLQSGIELVEYHIIFGGGPGIAEDPPNSP